MITLIFSLLISIIAGTTPQTTGSTDSKTSTTSTQSEQTISTFGGASTWSDVTE